MCMHNNKEYVNSNEISCLYILCIGDGTSTSIYCEFINVLVCAASCIKLNWFEHQKSLKSNGYNEISNKLDQLKMDTTATTAMWPVRLKYGLLEWWLVVGKRNSAFTFHICHSWIVWPGGTWLIKTKTPFM